MPDDEAPREAPQGAQPQRDHVAPSTPHAHGGERQGARPAAVVAIGASAGGLAALKRLLSALPDDAGLAFVVVVHLSPDHESHLVNLLQPFSRLPVEQIAATTTLERDHVYVIPPGSNVSSIDTHLRLSELERERRDRAPIDHFFRTLSETHDGHSVAVVLTGTGSDGALGLRTVKERGGLTIVQDPLEAEYDGMPQAAIATGMVDLVLRLEDIPAAILSFIRTEPRVEAAGAEPEAQQQERVLQQLFALVRSRSGRDFSRYKRSTLLRRTGRRMQIHGIERLDDYLALVRRTPAEVEHLADEFLVTVTEFFRDADVFTVLERTVVPKLFAGKGPGDHVRVWSVGCSTGEEAYSLAILLLEHAATLESPPRVQLFASDLHETSLRRARDGIYPETIEPSVSPARLRRFFVKEHDAYRVRRELREVVVVTPHNLLSDAPFSRLDLLVCRNVLIYLERGIQGDVVELFHYALAPGGYLLLGPSETFDRDDLFAAESKAHSLYRKREAPQRDRRLPSFPLAHHSVTLPREPPRSHHLQGFAEIHSDLLGRVGPPSILIDADDTVLHLSHRAGSFLRHPGGELTGDVVRLVRDELRLELRSALQAARETQAPTRSAPVHLRRDGGTDLHDRMVTMDVRPGIDQRHEGVMLVLFEERVATAGERVAREPSPEWSEESLVAELQRELELTRRRLQDVIEDADSGAEEMRASNEELQSMNEELRSAMEELETSKEELQSANEELITVNEENRHKVEELAQMGSDLQTLMSATEIATLFLDRRLRILRFTPRLGELFNVRHGDRGRPVRDLTHRFGSHDLVQDAARVLERLVPIERELTTDANEHYLTRIHPYRTADDRIDGIVITFVDITQHKEAERRVREANASLERLVAERTRDLEHANRELEAFNHSVSHDLRAPLRGIERFSRTVLEHHAADLDEGGRELLREVMAGAARLTELVDGLTELSKVSRAALRWEHVDVSGLAEEIVAELRSRSPERSPEVAIQPGLRTRGDRRLLRVVLANVLDNAWKFTRGEPVARIEVGAHDGDPPRLFVRDNGAGFDARAAHRLFAPFQRLHTVEEFEGTGVGLALAHRIITRHGGTIEATGEIGAGATVTFSLPATPPDGVGGG
jgi:two-component system, chemotaxis family, CheB/CheR fusion protein